MAALTVIYFLLTWYLSQVFSASSGSSRKFYFPLDPSYWGFKNVKSTVMAGDTIAKEQAISLHDKCARVHKLSKTYGTTTALKEVSMSMEQGQVFCLLGSNGSGKSTTVNMLSGLHQPTHGDAFLFGYSITEDVEAVQALAGICPQDDILWEEMTGPEHVKLYAKFRGVMSQDIDSVVHESLKTVNLHTELKSYAGSYSGGMKRRLSVALASVGAPRIIFLDEPTTGMDPLSRRRVWGAIEKLKENRIVVLTTQDMTEADALGDKIGILSYGRLRAMGSSLFLKRNFGAGYQINILSDPQNIPYLKSFVERQLPQAEILGDFEAGNMTVSLKRKDVKRLPNFFRAIEGDDSGHIKEWSISDSTLEEVFLRLVAQNKNVNAVIDDGEDDFDDATRYDHSHMTRKCVLCDKRDAENVILYTADKVAVQVDNIVCGPCARGEGAEDLDASNDDTQMIADVQMTAKKYGDDDDVVADETVHDTNNYVVEGDKGFRYDVAVPMVTQAKAVMAKSLVIQMRQRKTLCCYVIVLIVLILVSILTTVSPPALCEGGYVKNYAGCIAQSSLVPSGNPSYTYSYNGQTKFLVPDDAKTLTGYGNAGNGRRSVVMYTDSKVPGDTPLVEYNAVGYGKGVMNNTASTTVWRHFYWRYYNGADVNEFVENSQRTVIEKSTPNPFSNDNNNGMNTPEYVYVVEDDKLWDVATPLFPDFGVDITRSQLHDQGTPVLHYNLKTYISNLRNPNGYSDGYQQYPSVYLQGKSDEWSYIAPYTDPTDIHAAMSRTNNALLMSLEPKSMNSSYYPAFEPTYAQMGIGLNSFPTLRFPKPSNNIMAISICFPLAMMLFLPTFTFTFTQERNAGLLFMMNVVGMTKTAYYVTNYVYQFLINLSIMILFLLFAFIAGSEAVTGANLGLVILTILLWAHAQFGVSLILSSIIPKPRGSSMLAILLAVAVPLMTSLLAGSLSTFPTGMFMFVPFAAARAINLLLMRNVGDEIVTCLLVLAFVGTVYILVGVYLSAIIPNGFNQPEKLTYCLDPLMAKFGSSSDSSEDADRTAALLGADSLSGSDYEDIDVKEERDRVAGMRPGDAGVLIRDMNKLFRGRKGAKDKLAVNNLSLSLRYGECFGLLGPNGAGKTTTISILSGLLEKTAGQAFVGGHDITKDRQLIYRALGVCPQFDIVFDDFSVSDHLRLYARLKGVSPDMEASVVMTTAEKVGLDGDAFNQMSSELSGGMKRRLSLAMAVIGEPKVLYLDEPTTGLDPETKKAIWKIIEESSRDRCVILTTHSMEEADTLCSRIGIMAQGRLQCLGSQMRLKRRFGEGFTLRLNVANKEDDVTEFVTKYLCREAKLVQKFGKSRTYVMPQQEIAVSQVFNMTESVGKHQYNIREWGFLQTSLEEVFVRIVTDAEIRAEETQDGQSAPFVSDMSQENSV
eukprot:GFYU01004190.1.p1 GENE.GFYU01004190.1~~GFYU01004190.1.p1  ORF type:complete len:1422 (-),score=447.32 GFYU01004190.1:80-4345(-)